MNCVNCHHDGGVGGISTGDYRTNILTLHDDEENTNLMGSRPVLCASCHASPALGTPLQPGIPYFSHAMHNKHAPEDRITAAQAITWLRGTGTLGKMPVNPNDGTNDCYQCHPGVQTACLRDVMSQGGMWCTDCHGDMERRRQREPYPLDRRATLRRHGLPRTAIRRKPEHALPQLHRARRALLRVLPQQHARHPAQPRGATTSRPSPCRATPAPSPSAPSVTG